MFEDLFDTQEEIATGVKEGQVLSAWDRLPRTCADALPLPELARKPGYPIGLKNQGATCYLNSLLQILFHTPQLRKTILELPLCVGSCKQKSQFLNASKHKFMLGFQRLFSEMSLKNTYDLSTQYLKEAFGWEGSEHVVQHDIEEAMKIIFDTFERALEGTQYEKNIKDLFKGTSSRYKSCKVCGITQERLQDFYGLNLQVQNCVSLDESIMGFLTAESMDGENQIYCENCKLKQDMLLGSKLKQLPNVLVFTLARFAFNYETFDRVKLNNFFSFNLEANFSHLLDDTEANADTAAEYELYGVLIHRGSAHAGHYFCYIRDIMQESNWKVGLQDQAEKQVEGKDDNSKQDKNTNIQEKIMLVEPENKKLLENWFELDDGRVTAIEASKITTKYEGSESAYILFYRKKNSPLPEDVKVPEYFVEPIKVENEALEKARAEYDEKKHKIVLNIDDIDVALNVDTKLKDIVTAYCGEGFALVNEAKHNGLPYYPKQISSAKNYQESDTIKSMDLVHESKWKKYLIDSDEYRDIQPFIEVARMPFEVNVHYEQNEKLVLYQDETLSSLKLKLQKKYKIAYEGQIIKLTTAYREYFVTDDLSNDDILLTKLGFIHQCQVVLKKLDKEGEEKDAKQEQEKIETNTICFVIERDDVFGIKRMYFDKQKTLKQLLDFICESEGLDVETTRRLRNLNGDRLFYNDQYNKTLVELNFDEEIVKLKIERGEVPIKGDICVIAKMQSKFQNEGVPAEIECIFDPNTTILELKEKICEIANLKPELHRVYQTDWMGEPVRCITKEKQSVFDAKFGKQEKICIRDIESPIGAELINFEVYVTMLGTPEDVRQPITHVKIEEHKTLRDLKTQLIKTGIWQEIKELKINQLRVREIKKDYMFGPILRDNNKELKHYTFNTNKIVVQVLSEEEQLTENQIVLVLKKRNRERRIFEGNCELIFEAGKAPTIQDLDSAIHQKLELPIDEKLKIVKYVHYDFQWVQVSEKYIDKCLKSKASKSEVQNKNKKETKKASEKKNQNSTKNQDQQQQNQDKKQDKEENKNTKIKNQLETVQTHVEQSLKQVQQKEKVEVEASNVEKQIAKTNNQKELEPQQNTKKNAKNKAQKQGKQAKQPKDQKPKEQHKREDCLNLRKFPYLLKDGDWIGYGNLAELEGDDFQTDDDLTLRMLKKNEKAVVKRNRGPEKAFKVNIDF